MSIWTTAARISAGVHTVEIRAKDYDRQALYGNDGYKGGKYGLKKGVEYTGSEYRFIINPNKSEENTSDRDVTMYKKALVSSVSETEKTLNRDKWELQLKDYRYTRVDVCFNIDADYETTAKLVRLLVLTIAKIKSLDNGYLSVDPIDGRKRTLKVSSAETNNPYHLEIEHYDRSQKEQTDYEEQIKNRLEIRPCGRLLGEGDRADAIKTACNFVIDILNNLKADDIRNAMAEINEGILKQWKAVKAAGGKYGKFETLIGDRLYTETQMRALRKAAGANLSNFSRDKAKFELYAEQDVLDVCRSLTEALKTYLQN